MMDDCNDNFEGYDFNLKLGDYIRRIIFVMKYVRLIILIIIHDIRILN